MLTTRPLFPSCWVPAFVSRFSILLSVCFAIAPSALWSQGGTPDSTFGLNGVVRMPIAEGFTEGSTALQSDGKIIGAGASYVNNKLEFALARFTTNGSLDPTFHGDGKVTTAFPEHAVIHDIAVQPDGRIVAVGSAGDAYALARYLPDGQLDSSFSTDGKVTTEFGGGDFARTVILQPDGKIVAAGISSYNPNATHTQISMARYHPDGALDLDFGTGGKVLSAFTAFRNGAADLALLPDGKLLLTGVSTEPGGSSMALARYTESGLLDPGFGTGGRVLVSFGEYTEGEALAVLPDGRFLVGGGSFNSGDWDFLVTRFHADGSPDLDFGDQGKTTLDLGGNFEQVVSLAIQADHKIVAAGNTGSYSTPTSNYAVARLTMHGVPDSSFGQSGTVIVDLSPGFNELHDMVLQPDGKIIATGQAFDPQEGTSVMGLLRLNPGILTSSHQPEIPGFTVSPNPATDRITIAAAAQDQAQSFTAIVTDAFGRIEFMQKVEGGSVDISRLVPGVYYLKILAGGRSSTRRFVKI